VGRSYESDVPLDPPCLPPGGAPPLPAAFHHPHERPSGHADREAPAETVNLRVQLRAERPRVPIAEIPAGAAAPTARTTRRIWLEGRPPAARVFDRSAPGRGARPDRPALVGQPDTAVPVPGGRLGEVARFA